MQLTTGSQSAFVPHPPLDLSVNSRATSLAVQATLDRRVAMCSLVADHSSQSVGGGGQILRMAATVEKKVLRVVFQSSQVSEGRSALSPENIEPNTRDQLGETRTAAGRMACPCGCGGEPTPEREVHAGTVER